MTMNNPRMRPVSSEAMDNLNAANPYSSQSLDFAVHDPRNPFGGQNPYQPFQGGQAQNQGYQPTPLNLVGRAGQTGGGAQRITRDGVTFVSTGGGGQNQWGGRSDLQYGNRSNPGGQASGWEVSRDAMLDDMSRIQGAGDRMFDRQNQNNQGMANLVGSASGRIEGAANREGDRMDQFANRMEDPNGQGQGDFNKASQYAEDAVNTQKRAESEYKDNNAQLMASTSEAVQRSFQQQENEINNSDMTDDEKRSALSQIKSQKMSQLSQALAPLATRGQEFLAGLKNNIAQTQMAAAGTMTSIGAQRGQVLQMAQRAREFASNLRAAAPVTATQMEMQGRGMMGDMIRNNPETVVSEFQSLMSMYGANQAYNLAGAGGSSWGAPQQQHPYGKPANWV